HGMKQVAHSGGTAGYQTYLARYPDKKLSVAAMCNGNPPSSGTVAHNIVDEIFGPYPQGAKPQVPVAMTEDRLKKYVGIFRDEKTHFPLRFTIDKGALKLGGTDLKPLSETEFMIGIGRLTFTIDKNGNPIAGQTVDSAGAVDRFVAEKAWTPTAADLATFTGDWFSDEAQAGVSFVVENGKAFIVNKPVIRLELQPVYKDHFIGGEYVIWFTRKKNGQIERMHVGGGRMRDMFFERKLR
ncbi:MAG: hypothetical protein IT173_13145, partial [Acidobacteria bacterium]|nr:hypothetical protein [Acidobacteriota bacterium]